MRLPKFPFGSFSRASGQPATPTTKVPTSATIGQGGRPLRSRPRRTLKQHLIRRLMMMVPMSLLAVLMLKMGWLDQIADRLTFSDTSWFDNTALVEHLRIVITHDGLTDTPARCLLFIINGTDPLNSSRIDVMEKHSGSCPGDKKTLPKLFTLQVDRVDHIVSSDKGSPGIFRPIP